MAQKHSKPDRHGAAGTNIVRYNNYCAKITKVFVFIILCVFPLLVDKTLYTNITGCKENAWAFLARVYWLMCLLAVMSDVLNERVTFSRISGIFRKMNAAQMVMLGYIFWWIISALQSEWRDETWFGVMRGEGIRHILLYGITFILVSAWGKYSEKYILGIAAMAIVFGTISLLQVSGIHILYQGDCSFWNTGFLGTIGHIDVVAGLLVMCIPLLFCGFVLIDGKKRFLFIPGMVLLAIIQVICNVDSSKIGLLTTFAVVFPFLVDRKTRFARTLFASGILIFALILPHFLQIRQHTWAECLPLSYDGIHFILFAIGCVMMFVGTILKRSKWEFRVAPRKIHIALYILLLILVVCLFIYVYNYTGDNLLMRDASAMFHGEFTEQIGSGRGMIWKGAFQIIREHPIFGCGPGTYLYAMDPYNEWGSWETREGTQIDFAHNDFLQIAACEGIVGLVLYLALLLCVFIPAIKLAEERTYLIILGAAVVGFLVNSFFSFSISIISPLFWVLLALLNHGGRRENYRHRIVSKKQRSTVP